MGISNILILLGGLGAFLFGMKYMGDGLELAAGPKMNSLLERLTGTPVKGFLLGALVTAVIQSSSASVGVLQALAMQNLMPIHFALYIICGIEIGSVMPLFLASLSARNNAKRAAFIYFVYNLAGALIFVPVNMLTPYTDWIATLSPKAVVQVSLCHIFFKLATAIILLPLTKPIVNLTYKFVPKKKHENEKRLMYIDQNMKTTSLVAIKQVTKEVDRMYSLVMANFKAASKGVISGNIDMETLNHREDIINYLNHSITNYLVYFGSREASDKLHKEISDLMHIIIDIERVGDHAINIAEKVQHCIENKIVYSDEAQEEIKNIIKVTTELLEKSMDGFRHGLTGEQAKALHRMEETVDTLTLKSEDNHVERLRQHKCRIEPGITFAELLHDYERVGDHADNIVWTAKMIE